METSCCGEYHADTHFNALFPLAFFSSCPLVMFAFLAPKLKEVRLFIAEFSPAQRRQAGLFFLGVFCFKYARESSSLSPFALSKLDHDGQRKQKHAQSFRQLGVLELLVSISLIMGGSFVAPLVNRWPIRSVLACCACLQALTIVILIVVETSTGGDFKPRAGTRTTEVEVEAYDYYGQYSIYALIPTFFFSGLFTGIVYTMLKTVPRQIAGSNPPKLRFLTAVEQTLYELAAIAGALCAALIFIPRLGANIPVAGAVFAGLAALVWYFLLDVRQASDEAQEKQAAQIESSCLQRLCQRIRSGFIGASLPLQSLWQGAKITCTNRQLIWLVVAYTFTQYSHAIAETNLALIIGQRYLGNAKYTQTIVAGSNIGEFCGAVVAMVLQPHIPSPLPWVRFNALMLLLIWFFPYWRPAQLDSASAWTAAAIVLPMGASWSAAAVSLYSYMQTLLPDEAPSSDALPPLSCTAGFLFALDVTAQAIAHPILGMYVDRAIESSGTAHLAMKYVGGVQLSVIATIILGSTLIPRGALSLGPKACMPIEEEKRGNEEER